ncbi:MAG TPA: hypothetical protein VKE73_12680 [Myxococcota bacterium]|nr:hypothetical protein [Myxococcota bacterium]
MSGRGERCARGCAGVLCAIALWQLTAQAPAASAAPRGFDRDRSPHFLLYQDADTQDRIGPYGSGNFDREVLQSLESARALLAKVLDLAPRHSITVVIYDPQVFDTAFGAVLPFPAAGFYQGVIRVRGFARVTPDLERVLRHEYVHAAFDAVAPSLVLPALLNEGIAEWFARATTGVAGLGPNELRWLGAAAADGTLPHLDALLDQNFAGWGPGAAGAYVTSTAFVSFLVQQDGEEGLRELCRTLLRTGSLDRALERAYGQTLAELDDAFRGQLIR